MSELFKWSRISPESYEVSSKGDKRYSAFWARLSDGRTIEMHYQCDIKGFDIGGTNWKLGKGKPPKDPDKNIWEEYLKLWRTWADENPTLLEELKWSVIAKNYTLSDMFGWTQVNQARALATILNERFNEPESQ